jgi:hypothetical protein
MLVEDIRWMNPSIFMQRGSEGQVPGSTGSKGRSQVPTLRWFCFYFSFGFNYSHPGNT